MLATRDAELTAVEADLAVWYTNGPFAPAVTRPAAYRGVAHLAALTSASEVGDWRRLPPRAPDGVHRLVPSEYSSGESVHRDADTTVGTSAATVRRAMSGMRSRNSGKRRFGDAPRPAASAAFVDLGGEYFSEEYHVGRPHLGRVPHRARGRSPGPCA